MGFWGEEQDGSSSSNPSVPLPRRDESPAGDDWVLVGSSSPAPGDLGALEPLRTPASSAHSSNLPSSTVSEAGDEEEGEPEPASTRVVNQRPNAAPSRLDALAMAEAKSLKSAQLEKQRTTGKTLSSKALKRTNNSRHAEVGKRANSKRTNFPIKMAGNRNLKQC